MFNLSVPDISEKDLQDVVDVLKSGYLIYGNKGVEFEKVLAEYLGVRYAILVSSGTAALHLALLTIGIGSGDTVIVPDFTFPATANAVEITGADVLLADVNRYNYNIDPLSIWELVRIFGKTKRIRAIIPVHEFGCPANLDEIYAIAQENSFEIIEDAACAFGSEYKERKLGAFGNLCCFSFHPRKALTTGEGGFIATNNDEYANKIRLMRNHGIEYTESGTIFTTAGYNYRMTNFQAALGLSQFKRFDDWLIKRRQLYKKYNDCLGNNQLLTLPEDVPGHSWQTYMVVLDKSIDRNQIIKKLKEKGVETNLGAHALHTQPYYTKKYGASLNFNTLKIAEFLYTNGLALPFHHGLTENDIKFISDCLLKEIGA